MGRYHPEVLHRLAIVDVAQRAGFTLEEIRELTGPRFEGHAAGERLREFSERKRPEIEALIQRAQAVKRWLEIASACDCATVDVCSLFTDAALAPPEWGALALDVGRLAA